MTISDEFKAQLTQRMIPFWSSLADTQHGGFTGEHDGVKPHPTADKGSIYHARILWFFSSCAAETPEPGERERLLKNAAHAYEFIKRVFIDEKAGGVYWTADYTGKPLDTDKHVYALAFTLYGLSAYYRAAKNPEVLALARAVFTDMETHYRTPQGYIEQCDANFTPQVNKKLSESLFTPKTMNSMLHVMEAYTEFFNAAGEGKEALGYIYGLILDHVLCDEKGRMDLFFDDTFRPQSDEKSYGHDIEASWLLTEAARALGRLPTDQPRFLRLLDTTLAEGFDGTALANEHKNGVRDTDRIWWVQAEAVVGLVNGYELTGSADYLKHARAVWEYTKANLIGEKEWFWGKTITGKPFDKPFAGMWKCPYHNGRMFLEVIKRHVDF
ncbi:cellobiose 2-epimerase [Spirochaetia bacterium]|nr:cellobiose 2-epimerase [Spirochaetia bacterium]